MIADLPEIELDNSEDEDEDEEEEQRPDGREQNEQNTLAEGIT